MSELKILIYGNRKSDDEAFDASTPEKEAAAYLKIFKMLDEDWQVYDDLEDLEEPKICRFCDKGLHDDCVSEQHPGSACICEATADCKRRNRNFRWQFSGMKQMKKLYDAAKAGDAEAVKKLITERSKAGYEYENVKELTVQDATL